MAVYLWLHKMSVQYVICILTAVFEKEKNIIIIVT